MQNISIIKNIILISDMKKDEINSYLLARPIENFLVKTYLIAI